MMYEWVFHLAANHPVVDAEPPDVENASAMWTSISLNGLLISLHMTSPTKCADNCRVFPFF